MRVGVDATVWANWRGFGRFARNAVGRLVELDRDTTYVLYSDRESAARVQLPPDAEWREVALRRPPVESLTADFARGPVDLLRLTRAASRRELDAFLFPSVDTCFPVFGVPTVVGIYDTVLDEFPEQMLPSRRARAFWRIKQSWALRRAARLFTLSEASRAMFVARFGIARERIAVVSAAPAPVFAPRSGDTLVRGLEPLGLAPDRPFVLYAGGIGAHKNLETLLDAYAGLRSRRRDAPALVIVGPFDEVPYRAVSAPVRERIARLGLAGAVQMPGLVSDEALACLYSAATAVVVTSLAEGFGLPAVEAAACGAPVVLSDIAAHRETLRDGALFFAAMDRLALAHQLARLLDDAALRHEVAQRGRDAVARLSWDDTARRLRELIADAAGVA
jgi:glycosyltransferase involved in cell wall biosynthesis